jgi:multiple sugar transport system substrate-binding protein
MVLALALALTTACSTATSKASETENNKAASIAFWTYPIGLFSEPSTVNKFIKSFNKKYPNIKVTVEYLDYNNGDDQVDAAIDAGTTPDVIMEGPERLVANWGERGKMLDIGDLWTKGNKADINAVSSKISDACKGTDGKYYEYPLCITAHSMAINYEVFKKAGALRYIDQKNRTWSTEDFIKACSLVKKSGLVADTGIIYCGGQGGDQGTRALVTNLYGGRFTNASHTRYTIDSSEGIRALKTLKSMTDKGILSVNSNMQAADELQKFAAGETAMTFAWNASNQENYVSDVDFTPYAMTFPVDSGKPELCSGIWGFGIFDKGSKARARAAKTFVKFLCEDKTQAAKSVRATGFFPADASIGNVYKDTNLAKTMNTYSKLERYIGDYYSITPGWTAQRTAWWNMLQQVFAGTDPKTALDQYSRISNDAAGE